MAQETTETVETEATEETETEGAENTGTEETAQQETETEDPNAGLKSALAKERAANKAHAKRTKELERELADRDKTADEKALDDVRREAADEAMVKANTRLVAAEFRNAAAKRVKDPRIAAKLVDLADIDVDDDGNVDAAGITAAIDALLVEYPDLAPSRFEGTADQGARGRDAAAPKQLTREDLKTMTAKEIVQAEKAGQLDRLKGKIK